MKASTFVSMLGWVVQIKTDTHVFIGRLGRVAGVLCVGQIEIYEIEDGWREMFLRHATTEEHARLAPAMLAATQDDRCVHVGGKRPEVHFTWTTREIIAWSLR